MTQEQYEKARNEAANEKCFDWNGCFTGDCPHSKAQQCGLHFFDAGSDWLWQSVQPVIEAAQWTIDTKGRSSNPMALLEASLAEFKKRMGVDE